VKWVHFGSKNKLRSIVCNSLAYISHHDQLRNIYMHLGRWKHNFLSQQFTTMASVKLTDTPKKKAKFLKPNQIPKLYWTVTVMNLNMTTMKLWMMSKFTVMGLECDYRRVLD
jgi:hypothetical protein